MMNNNDFASFLMDDKDYLDAAKAAFVVAEATFEDPPAALASAGALIALAEQFKRIADTLESWNARGIPGVGLPRA